jgi:hypothetical protein
MDVERGDADVPRLRWSARTFRNRSTRSHERESIAAPIGRTISGLSTRSSAVPRIERARSVGNGAARQRAIARGGGQSCQRGSVLRGSSTRG